MTTITRGALILRGFHAALSTLRGASPVAGGYRLDLADGTSRAATQAETDAATAWADARIAESASDDTDAVAVRSDAQIRNLILMSPAQIDAWGAANVGNLTQARTAIIILAKAVSMLGRRLLR